MFGRMYKRYEKIKETLPLLSGASSVEIIKLKYKTYNYKIQNIKFEPGIIHLVSMQNSEKLIFLTHGYKYLWVCNGQ